MNRLFDLIQNGKTIRFSEKDLPLKIGGGSELHIRLSGAGEVTGYLALSDNHLYFQPAPACSRWLHNGTKVETSVWIKSGDRLRLGGSHLHFDIHPHLVEIVLSGNNSETQNNQLEHSDLDLQHENAVPSRPAQLPRKVADRHRPKSLIPLAGLLLALVLAAMTLFVIKGNVFFIDIEPIPDRIKVSGTMPVIDIWDRYFGWPGDYTLKATREGYQPLQKEFTVTGNPGDHFLFQMDKLPGKVSITSEPAKGALVALDGREIGRTPIELLPTPAGSYSLSVRMERYRVETLPIEIHGMGQKQSFHVRLLPAWGTLVLETSPKTVEVAIGEQVIGSTPGTIEVPEGHHRLTLSSPGFLPRTLEVSIQGGQETVLPPVSLTPEPIGVGIRSKPSGAAILVDDEFKGNSPLELYLEPGREYTLKLSLPGYETITRMLSYSERGKHTLDLILVPVYGSVFTMVEPPDARLSVNGVQQKDGAVGRLRLQAQKRHTLLFTKPGYHSKKVSVTPSSEYTRQIMVKLVPEGNTRSSAAARLPSAFPLLFTEEVHFRMGASRRDPGRRANEQARTITLRRPVFLGTREVTNAEFRRFRPSHRSGNIGRFSLDGVNQPVVNITWEDAAKYCNWLSKQEGLAPFYVETAGKVVPAMPLTTGYRLPTEAEWAYAARVAPRSDPVRYPWQGGFPPKTIVGNFADRQSSSIVNIILPDYDDGFPVSAPVGTFPPNRGGYFDFGGNVSEWCHDYYTSGFNQAIQEVDPLGPDHGTHRVVRGSSWRDGSIVELRLSYRSYAKSGKDNLGFRVARYLQ